MQFDGFGTETDEPNTKFKCVCVCVCGWGDGGIYSDPLVYQMGTRDTPMEPFLF